MASSSCTPEVKHDVFLSFRGEDTRNNFTSHLYAALCQKNIKTFMDTKLHRGDEISPSLMNAIKGSKISVVIFSQRYASSKWCLEELVKVNECNRIYGQIVIPVFFHVNSSDVRRQTGSFGDAFAKLKQRFKGEPKTLQVWRNALTEAANITGFDSNFIRVESKLIRKIVKEILRRLIEMSLSCNNDLVGVESYMRELIDLQQRKLIDSFSSTTPQPKPKRVVFLCHGGEDTRDSFTSHLYAALRWKKIDCFTVEKLHGADHIAFSLLKAIEESKISIIIFSKNFAYSGWTLDELVKVLECKQSLGQVVLPIFYNVDPSHVRNQTGPFEASFVRFEEDFRDNLERVKQWRYALTEAGTLSGWCLNGTNEAEVIDQIVKYILKRLNKMSPSDDRDLVGVESRIKKIESVLSIGSKKIPVVGIWGISGIGKTTLARALFNKIWNKFEGSCFVENIREESEKGGLSRLRQELLSTILEDDGNPNIGLTFTRERLGYKRVLIAFDDVTRPEQIRQLIGNVECLGLGSQIIITTRDKQVLKNYGVDDVDIYKVEGLCDDDALRLFKRYAFRQSCPVEDYRELLNKVVAYAKGVPLALKVLGSLLYGKTKQDWESQIDKLERCPLEDVQKVLKISYDELDSEEKNIFLYIACFFNGKDRCLVKDILYDIGLSSQIGISRLIDKSLITISFNIITMHDLVQELGREIVRQECIINPGKRSRLWLHEDIYRVLTSNKGSEEISGICLDMSETSDIHLHPHAFENMHNLRFLKLYNSKDNDNNNKLHGFEDIQCAFTELRYLHWNGYPLKSLPPNFHPDNLVRLEMPHSNIEQLWNGARNFVELKHIDLSHSRQLVEIPDLSKLQNLQNLILEDCTSLFEINPSSIQNLNKLLTLNLRGCSNLRTAPKITRNVLRVYLDGTAIRELPSIECRSSLVGLYLSDCSRLRCLPNSICELKSLEELILSGCRKLERLPDDIGGLRALRKFEANDTAIREIPPSIVNLENLGELSLQRCEGQESVGLILPSLSGLTSLRSLDLSECQIRKLPDSIGQLSSLALLFLRGNNFESIPTSIKDLSNLHFLDLSFCERLQSLQEFPRGLHMQVHNCMSLEALADLSFFFSPKSLRQNVNLANCFKLDQQAVGDKVRDALPKTQDKEFYRALDATICYPGNDIPGWFSFRSVGSSLTPSLPQGWMNENFLGFAVCAVVAFPDHHNGGKNINVRCECLTENEGGEIEECIGNLISRDIKDDIPNNIRSDHVFLGCNLGMLKSGEAENPLFDPTILEWTIKFHAEHDCGKIECLPEVKKCGIHLLYAQDCGDSVEESTEVLNQMGNLGEPIEESTEALTLMTRKRKRNYNAKIFNSFWTIATQMRNLGEPIKELTEALTLMVRKRKRNYTQKIFDSFWTIATLTRRKRKRNQCSSQSLNSYEAKEEEEPGFKKLTISN